MIRFIVACGLALGYLVDTLLLRDVDHHEGPFIEEDKKILFPEIPLVSEEHYQKFSLFDRIRGMAPGVYYKQEDLWIVQDGWKKELWTCPKCLSMWLATPFSIFFLLRSKSITKTFIFHFAIAGVSTLYNFVVKRLMSS